MSRHGFIKRGPIDGVPVYVDRDKNSEVLTKLSVGSEIEILYGTTDDFFVEICLPCGIIGFCQGHYIKLSEE